MVSEGEPCLLLKDSERSSVYLNMLTLSLPAPVHHLALEVRRATSQMTPKMLILATGVFSLLALSVAVSVVYAGVPSCAAGESLLVYSRYNKKGIADGHAYSCGQPHQTCNARPGENVYDCSPFMVPKDSLSWR